MPIETRQIVTMLHVSDVDRSVAFYAQLGFSVDNSFTPDCAASPTWAWLRSGWANIMVTKSLEPVVRQPQAVSLYLYVDDVAGTYAELKKNGLQPGPIVPRFYAPDGEIELCDPDGFRLIFMKA